MPRVLGVRLALGMDGLPSREDPGAAGGVGQRRAFQTDRCTTLQVCFLARLAHLCSILPGDISVHSTWKVSDSMMAIVNGTTCCFKTRILQRPNVM